MEPVLDTKERITIAAGDLFFKFGIKSITMDDIAKSLGMSKKTLYQFYSDKDEIVINLMQKDLNKHQEDFIGLQKNSKNSIQEMLEMMKHLGEMFGRINPIIFYELQKYHPNAWKKFTDFKENCAIKMIQQNLTQGIEQGLYRQDINAQLMSRLRMLQVEWALTNTLMPEGTMTIAELQMALLDHFLHGICTLKGHKMINRYKEINEDE